MYEFASYKLSALSKRAAAMSGSGVTVECIDAILQAQITTTIIGMNSLDSCFIGF
jgi:hypothetical protein